MPTLKDILVLLPEFYLMAMGCLLLLLDAFIKEQQRGLLHWVAVTTLLLTTYLVLAGSSTVTLTAFGGMFVRDRVADILKVFSLLCATAVCIYSRPYLEDRKLFQGEFYTVMIFALIGVMLLVSAGNLVMIYLGLELLTLSSYGLVAFNRDSPLSSEAAMKYFVLGALSSGLLLYGMSMVYGACGSLSLLAIHGAILHVALPHLMLFGLIFMLTGIAFKLGAAPFHMWIPDVYQGAATPVTAFIASSSKLAAFGLAYRLLEVGMGDLAHYWQPMLMVLAVLSLLIGNLLAIVQTNLKRMLAYSTISHMGYLLIALLTTTREGYAAAMFYVISYALMATAAFGVILALARAGFECEKIDDFKGLNQRSPWMAFVMLLAMFSLAGVPPMYGFFAKYLVLQAAIDVNMLGLAVIGAVFAIIGLYYYLRVVKVMYFDKAEEGRVTGWHTDMTLRLVLSLNALLLLGFGLCWGPLLDWCRQAFMG